MDSALVSGHMASISKLKDRALTAQRQFLQRIEAAQGSSTWRLDPILRDQKHRLPVEKGTPTREREISAVQNLRASGDSSLADASGDHILPFSTGS